MKLLNWSLASCVFCWSFHASAAFAGGCATQDMVFRDGSFEVKVYRVVRNKIPDRAIIIIPPTGGTNLIDRSYARRLCYAGYDVYIVDRWSGDDETDIHLDLHQKLYTRALHAVTTALNHIPAKYVGVLGTSVGALFAEVVAGTVDRVDAVFTIVGGAPIPSVIVNSDQKAMAKLKQDRYELYHFKDDKEYLERLSAEFKLDPFDLERKFERKDLGMVIAQKDLTVPVADQLRQRDLWKPKKIISLPNNHFGAIIKTWLFHSRQIVRFFDESAASRGFKR